MARLHAAVTLLLLAAGTVWAEPYLATRTGMKCSACHVNVTGAGKRAAFGSVYSQTYLPANTRSDEGRSSYFSGVLENLVAVGANVRVANESTLGEGRRSETQQSWDNTFAVTEADLYVEMTVLEDALTLYLDQEVAPGGASSREALILLRGLPLQGYLKAGRMLLPYGLRIWDDEAAIRRRTGFNFDNQDLGVEAGIEPGPLSLSLSVSNGMQGGTDTNSDKMISAVGSIVTRRLLLGGSYARNQTADATARMYGAFGAVTLGRFGCMAEIDVLEERGDELAEQRDEVGDQLMFYTAVDVLMHRGVNLRLAYDYYDPYRRLGEDVQDAVTVGLSYFPMQFVELRAMYRRRDGIPQLPQEREDQVLLELHLFL